MRSGGPWMPGLFFLLLLPLPLMCAEGLQHSALDWTNSHQHLCKDWGNVHCYFSPDEISFHGSNMQHRSKSNKLYDCDGDFNLYFVLDASDSMGSSWKDIHQLVQKMVKKYTNPKLRMSFITYAAQGSTVMSLTSDRTEIQDGLKRLQNIVPSGATNMQEGLKKANEQIESVYSNNKNASSLIFTVTAGPLLPATLQDSKGEANKARSMKTTIYAMGIKDYKRDQLLQIVQGKRQVYHVDESNIDEGFIRSIVGNSCKQVMGKDTFYACVGESYQLGFFAHGLNPDKIKEYTCRYKLDEIQVYNKEPASVSNEKITCQGHIFAKTGQVIIVDYSLDLGKTYSKRFLKVTSKDCVEPPVPTEPTVPAEYPDPGNLLLLLSLIPLLAVISLLLLCLWCYRRISKEPKPAPKPAPKKPFPAQTRVIVSCGGCREDTLREMEGKLDTLCDFVQHCNQMPLMWCPTRNMHRCGSLSLPELHCEQKPCGSKICFQPSQDTFLLNNCCSRCHHPPPVCSQPPSSMLPLIPPTPGEFYRPSSSLPPP
ncbi:anthrax toxin receptor-like isoform X1 [Bos javanicus]|uniref:anthrax toxin receptor-like isoform X1 n=1 Tax=Bos javanicus TaxID=9906 RepID=UPI002AA63B59|nr:anthrax toxin receptor-like isoform X1 [Bos javanicus]